MFQRQRHCPTLSGTVTSETLNCPMCGAAARTDAPNCDHCGARLATVSCPNCFGLMFIGSRFCSHCGAAAARDELPAAKACPCPRCRLKLDLVKAGATPLRECGKCHGVWVEKATLVQLCSDREKQTDLLGNGEALEPGRGVNLEEAIRYVPCPECGELMNRLNFAKCSGVIVDVCRMHGTWFDKDELRRMVEFIRAGGLLKSRQREVEELEEKRRRLLQSGGGSLSTPIPETTGGLGNQVLIDFLGEAGELLIGLLKK